MRTWRFRAHCDFSCYVPYLACIARVAFVSVWCRWVGICDPEPPLLNYNILICLFVSYKYFYGSLIAIYWEIFVSFKYSLVYCWKICFLFLKCFFCFLEFSFLPVYTRLCHLNVTLQCLQVSALPLQHHHPLAARRGPRERRRLRLLSHWVVWRKHHDDTAGWKWLSYDEEPHCSKGQLKIIIIIIITQIYNARNVIITILKHHKMNLRRGRFAG